tara:strand:+ start:786 stop:1040 length:255 start_codon:yes stop_codon:yes gene_type:complete
MTWQLILKSAEKQWQQIIDAVKDDKLPIGDEFAKYSQLENDNRKMVDYWLKQGMGADVSKRMKCMREIRTEMLKTNNFRFWASE